jgi:hypothetical protein
MLIAEYLGKALFVSNGRRKHQQKSSAKREIWHKVRFSFVNNIDNTEPHETVEVQAYYTEGFESVRED